MTVKVTNNACSTIIDAIDDAVTTITVGPEGVFFPSLGANDWYYLTLSNDPVDTAQLPEIVRVVASTIDGGTGNFTLTVERGAGIDGALPKSWSAASDIQLLVTSELLYDLQSGGVEVSGATSWILNSSHVFTDHTLTAEENGYYLKASPGLDDLNIYLPEIPADDGSTEDIRYYINKRTLSSDGAVVVSATSSQTINGNNTLAFDQQYSTVVLHAKAGDTNWDATETMSLGTIPNDGNTYAVTYGPNWTVVTPEAPIDGGYYVRHDGDWVEGVPEAPMNGTTYGRNNGAWVTAGGGDDPVDLTALVPSGTVMPFAGTVAPTGYLFCDGAEYGKTEYATLFNVIGTSFGSSEATVFAVPDMRGRNARGLDNIGGTASGTYPGRESMGANGGNYFPTIPVSALPSHTHSGTANSSSHSHSLSINSGGSHTHTVNGSHACGTEGGGGSSACPSTQTTSSSGSHGHSGTASSSSHSHSVSVNASGAGGGFEAASPFLDMNYIIKS